MRMRSSYIVGVLTLLVGLTSSIPAPYTWRDLFWISNSDGELVPAFLRSRTSSLPSPVSIEEDCTFWHFLPGQADSEGRQILPNCADNCLSGFVKDAPLVIVGHGFVGGDGYVEYFGKIIRREFTRRGEPVNILIVDWSKLANAPDYIRAAYNIQPVGEYIATLINYLVDQGVATLNETYFVGHSLGAHIPNYISRNLNGGSMRAVFALDPAAPFFDIRGDEGRLDPSDAQFVNVIHTSTSFIGLKNPVGHVDFYPNGGKNQTGCDDNIVGDCSHGRVMDFFTESISNPEAFSSCKCESWEEYNEGSCSCEERAPMGWGTPITTRGVFYLRTNPVPPYSQN